MPEELTGSTVLPASTHRIAADNWLRQAGIPLVVPVRYWHLQLWERSAVALVTALLWICWLFALEVAARIAEPFFPEFLADTPSPAAVAAAAAFLGTLAGATVSAVVLTLVFRWILRRHPGARLSAAVAGSIGILLVPTFLSYFIGWWDNPLLRSLSPLGLLPRLLVIGAILLATWCGLGALLSWAGARVLRELGSLGPMVARALPLLILLVLFFYFSSESWFLALGLGWRRTLGVCLILYLLAFGLLTVHARTLMARVLRGFAESLLPAARQASAATGATAAEAETVGEGKPRDVTPVASESPVVPVLPSGLLKGVPPITELLAETPWQTWCPTAAIPELRRRERANFMGAIIVTQLIQLLVLTTLVALFLLAFGLVAVPDSVLHLWLGNAQLPPAITVFGASVSVLHLKVALIIAAFSGLSFAGSLTVEPLYREAFVRPLLREVARNLAARDAYVSLLAQDQPAGVPNK